MNIKLHFISLLLIPLFGMTAFGQVSLNKRNASLEEVLLEIKKQTGYDIVYNESHIKDAGKVTVDLKNVTLEAALSQILKEKNLDYSFRGNAVIIKSPLVTETESPRQQERGGHIEGEVVDEQGNKLSGVTLSILNTKTKVVSELDGKFKMNIMDPKEDMVISLLGFHPVRFRASTVFSVKIGQKIEIGNGWLYRSLENKMIVTMKMSSDELEEVIVNTGIFEMNKEIFTGATRSFSGKELRNASRQNILEGLNMLDPSFKIIRNNELGSDPNQLPQVEIRGSRSVPLPTGSQYSQQLKLEYEQDPNQPLFILDGFETTLATIVGLDVNRIASLTLLKDAASTALYGSRSANGVVVVETIRPTPGDLRVSYNATSTIAMPDLTSYNMMNAAELLKFQELTSMDNGPGPFARDWAVGRNLVIPELKHSFRENAVLSGVDEDWKKVPLQTSTVLNHALSVMGGDNFFSYNIGLTAGSNVGVMKGAENKNKSGYANLSYRKGKLNISNNLTISGENREGSPYGTFTQYVRIPPYYVVNNSMRYLEQHYAEYYNARGELSARDYTYANPLYNANLPYKNTVTGLTIANNLMANWDVLPFMRLSTGIQYSKSTGQSDFFTSPLNTIFDTKIDAERGTYEYNSSSAESFRYFLAGNLRKIFASKHIVNMNLRGDIGQRKSDRLSMSAVGFASTAEPLIYLARSYRPNSKPGGSTAESNSIAVIGSMNYSYDMRYNLDFSYNLSGTSNFGSDNPYQSFYAVGAGWNISKEAFLANSDVVDYLNLSANFGLTGNQNAGNFGSRSTYILNNDPSFFGEAYQFNGLGNPNLEWTKTYNLSYMLSGKFFKKLSVSLSGYRNVTDPLIVAIPLPLSVGLPEGIPKNIGKLTSTGLEFIADIRLKNTRDWTVNLGINTPLFYKSEYSGLGDQLDKFNDIARGNNFLQRYTDGSSPDDVWAVRSLGIGQARGFEVFLDKDGNYTYLFDKNNEVAIGTSRAMTQGNINLSVRYKRFTIAMYSRYVVQEMKFNKALYNKVENIGAADIESNQDKRALYVRWKEIGDDASFLGISNTTLGMSSRFLQKENAFYVDGLNFNYDLVDQYSEGLKARLRKKLGLQTLGFGLTTTNIFKFQLSNVRMERGLDFPFQRSVTFNMNLTF
ncbi:SusC/RagA family TonB-linked outer membrane protein [Sphingobacterium lumbrici]|uniref:SusC/RagA family TonB-linked outer membrane protein n=1 Tax=Sphingobacterium lumbrici TaxID=2559600 RepID=UPI00112CDE62|nr:SusC/RagA family TonB-linked outer membrane protein [Sphingobacterium lumbrici]